MSGFKDTFTKEDSKSSLLEYDDNAFLYFAGTVLFVILVPWTFNIIRRYAFPVFYNRPESSQSLAGCYCKCSLCQQKLRNKQSSQKFLAKLRESPSLALQIIGIVTGWVCLVCIFTAVGTICSFITTFDPYEILNITVGASDKQIKKAYRTMSLRYHPDRNKNDPTAAAKFIIVSKAFNALTDEIAKRNFEKYGNPDGPGMMKVGIGLPSILMNENAQLLFLLSFTLIVFILIPMIFVRYYYSTQKYMGGSGGVEVQTVHLLSACLSDKSRVKQCIDLLAISAEARAVQTKTSLSTSTLTNYEKLIQSLPAHAGIQNKQPVAGRSVFERPSVTRNLALLWGHVTRQHSLMDASMTDQLNKLLRIVSPVTRTMMETSFINNWFYTIYAIVELRRTLTQALGIPTATSLLQLPHLSSTEVAGLCKEMKGIQEFRKKTAEERKKLLPERLNSTEIDDICEFVDVTLPDIAITGTISVEDEAEMVVGDVATINLLVERKNGRVFTKESTSADDDDDEEEEEDPHPRFVHCPLNQKVTQHPEEWWFFASDVATGVMLTFQTSQLPQKKNHLEMMFPLQKPGASRVLVVAMCDAYHDVDQVTIIPMRVKTRDQVSREMVVHPEDLSLDDHPTLLQQVVGGQSGAGGYDDSDDSSSSDEASNNGGNDKADDEGKEEDESEE